MTLIPNFPRELLEEHRRWHRSRHSVDPDRPPVGYGQEFLAYHRSYIRKALEWYRIAGLDPRLVEPWPSVPEPIRQASCYDRNAEARILLRPETFASSDELGRFIEASGVHGCIHEIAADLYGEPDINDFDEAPRNTVFYNIHGMIDNWWRNWEGLGRFGEGMPYWSGRFYDSEDEVLRYRREDSTWWLGKPERRGALAEAAGGPEYNVGGGGGSGSGAGMASSGRQGAAGQAGRSGLAHPAPQAGVSAGGAGAAGAFASLEWGPVGASAPFGRIDDGRPFRVWDTDGDGRLEVLFQSPFTGDWWEGSLRNGRLEWSQIRLQRTGQPTQERDSLTARSRRKRKTPT